MRDNIETILNGFNWNGESFNFTNDQLNISTQGYDSFWILSDTQVGVEGNNQIILFDITVNTIDGDSYSTILDFKSAIGL